MTPRTVSTTGPLERLGESVVRGGAWQSSSKVLAQIFTLVVSVVAARALGPSGMGSFVFIVWVYTTLVAVLAAGLPVAVNRYTAELLGSGNGAGIRRLYGWARVVAAVAAALGGGILVSIALLGGEPRSAWFAAAVACSASILQTVPNAILLGARWWQPASVIGLASGFVGAVAKLALLGSGRGIEALLVVDAFVTAFNLVAATMYARRVVGAEDVAAAPPDLIERVRVYALGSSLGAILTIVVLQRSEVFFLERFTDEVEIALYSIPFSALEVLNFVPATLGIAAGSAFAALYGAEAFDRIGIGFGRAIRLTLLVTVPLTAASLALGPLALRLAYGSAYEDTAPVLLVLVAVFPVVSLMFIGISLIQGYGRQRVFLLALLASAIVGVVLDVALIPSFGALGAAWAKAGAQTLLAVVLVTYASRLAGGATWDLVALARITAVSAVAALAALGPISVLRPLPGFLAAGVAFLVVFAVGAPLVRVIPARDSEWLTQYVGNRLGGRLQTVVRNLSPRTLEAARR